MNANAVVPAENLSIVREILSFLDRRRDENPSWIRLFNMWMSRFRKTRKAFFDIRSQTGDYCCELFIDGQLSASATASSENSVRQKTAEVFLRRESPLLASGFDSLLKRFVRPEPPTSSSDQALPFPEYVVPTAQNFGSEDDLRYYQALRIDDPSPLLYNLISVDVGGLRHKTPAQVLTEVQMKCFPSMKWTSSASTVRVKRRNEFHSTASFGSLQVSAVSRVSPKAAKHHAAQQMLKKLFPDVDTYFQLLKVTNCKATELKVTGVVPSPRSSAAEDQQLSAQRSLDCVRSEIRSFMPPSETQPALVDRETQQAMLRQACHWSIDRDSCPLLSCDTATHHPVDDELKLA